MTVITADIDWSSYNKRMTGKFKFHPEKRFEIHPKTTCINWPSEHPYSFSKGTVADTGKELHEICGKQSKVRCMYVWLHCRQLWFIRLGRYASCIAAEKLMVQLSVTVTILLLTISIRPLLTIAEFIVTYWDWSHDTTWIWLSISLVTD